MRSDGDGIVLVQKCDLYNLQTPNVDISISTGLWPWPVSPRG